MSTHLSCRLAWHDRGWDGHICDNPHLNSSCIVHKHIRESKDSAIEKGLAGYHLSDCSDFYPPCSRDPGAYSKKSFKAIHRDPLEFRQLPSVPEIINPYTTLPSPYRWMREENFIDICNAENLIIRSSDNGSKDFGWIFEPDRQEKLLKYFWQKIEPEKSLIFYYTNHGNPIDENTQRLLVGIGRIINIGQQLYFGTKHGYEDSYPIWSRSVTQDFPDQGIRLPYQEYINMGHDPLEILCPIPNNALMDFSYVAEHVSDDTAVAVIERFIQSVEKVKSDGIVAGDWDKKLYWLNDILAEVWSNRGAFPGLGCVLENLDFAKGTAFQHQVLTNLPKKDINPLEYVIDMLEETQPREKGHYFEGLVKASLKWKLLTDDKKELLKLLSRFELSRDQIERIIKEDLRKKSGFKINIQRIIDNPYLLYEDDRGTKDSDPIALETIDHGMIPDGDARVFIDDEINPDDNRRVRSVATSVLRSSSDNGDTVLPFDEMIIRVYDFFAERRSCKPDRDIILAQTNFYEETLWLETDTDPQLVALKKLRRQEKKLSTIIQRRIKRNNVIEEGEIDWSTALKKEYGNPENEREKSAINEKTIALQVLYNQRISVLTGGAGTGKTSAIKVLLDEIQNFHGKEPFLLLAPTGKARVRLSSKTKRNAFTIHQFLLRTGWLDYETFYFNEQGQKEGAITVVIDECSMIPTDLFATLIQALDMNQIKRLVLVGDPNQLPPIGPGRPFVDTIKYIEENANHCIYHLETCMRTVEVEGKEKESIALSFANGYRADGSFPGDDEILSNLALSKSQGDLEIHFWHDVDELDAVINDSIQAHLGITSGDYQSFNKSFGFVDYKNSLWKNSENWQILSPTRRHYYGTDELNNVIQKKYHKSLITRGKPKAFGEQEIVYTDKVIQITNTKLRGFPQESALGYVANGEIGLVHKTSKGKFGDYLQVYFSTQPETSYRYSRSKATTDLELAYSLTVHKAQGSDFDFVFFIIPQEASTLSRELLYTGLTRFRKKLILLVEKDIKPLLQFRRLEESNTKQRNTNMFSLLLRPDDVPRPYLKNLIHRTADGNFVRSKSEVIIADTLMRLDITYKYEEPLRSKEDIKDFRLPDFTVSFEGDTYYWEHLGMLSVPAYKEAWDRKKEWYRKNGYYDQLIVSKDDVRGGIDSHEIEQIARERIILE